MPLAPDDDVIVDGDAQPLPGVDDLAGHLDIRHRRRRIARRMIVDEHDG